jgi:hypothetical protein
VFTITYGRMGYSELIFWENSTDSRRDLIFKRKSLLYQQVLKIE